MQDVSLPRTSAAMPAYSLGIGRRGEISTEPGAFAVFDRFLELGGNLAHAVAL